MATLRDFIKSEEQVVTHKQVAFAKHNYLMTGNLDVYIKLITIEDKLSKVPYLCKSFTAEQLDIELGDRV